MDATAWFLLGVLVVSAVVTGLQVWFWQALPPLRWFPAGMPANAPWPRVSVVVPSCNEEAAVEAATRSLLAQDYPALQVVAVNDRSTDATGAILDRLGREHPHLTVVHVTELPAGWLGKNHAMHVGAARSTGEWVLFTDGDVVFARDALRRSVAAAVHAQLGHMVVMPRLICHTFWERAAQTVATGFISIRFRSWQLTRARTPGFIGVGAFNLVKRAAYDAVGGHKRLRMEVADDVKLGMLLRRSGVRQGLVGGEGRVSVRWQHGYLQSFGGLVKNGFAGVNWSWPFVLASVATLVVSTVLPYAAMALLDAPAHLALAVGCALMPMVAHGVSARAGAAGSGWEGITFPINSLMMAGTLLLSAVLATVRGGIRWRTSFYALPELRAGVLHDGAMPVDAVVGWTPPKAPSDVPEAA